MTTAAVATPEELTAAALSLPDAARAQLAADLLVSLPPPDAVPEGELVALAEDRLAAYRRGEIGASDWREFVAELEAEDAEDSEAVPAREVADRAA